MAVFSGATLQVSLSESVKMIYHQSIPVIVDYNQRYMIPAVTYQATVYITDDSLSCCRLHCLSPTLVRPNYSPLPERSHSRAGWAMGTRQ